MGSFHIALILQQLFRCADDSRFIAIALADVLYLISHLRIGDVPALPGLQNTHLFSIGYAHKAKELFVTHWNS